MYFNLLVKINWVLCKGYSVEDIKNTVIQLNDLLHSDTMSDLNSVQQKYSHK